MMSNDALFGLIQHLNRSEKRYFKQYLKRYSIGNTESAAALLFDYLSKAKTYDRKQLLSKCDFISEGQLQNQKTRLNQYIQRSLRAYHSDSSPTICLHQLMINYEMLLRKGLYQHCWTILCKADDLASRLEHYFLLEEILSKKEYLMTVRLKNKNVKEILLEIQDRRGQIHLARQTLERLKDLNSRVYNVFREEGRTFRSHGLLEKHKHELAELKVKVDQHPESIQLKTLSYAVSADIHRMEGEFREAVYFLNLAIELFHSDPKYAQHHLVNLHRLLNAKVINLNMLRDRDQAKEIVADIREAIDPRQEDKHLRVLIFENAFFQELESELQQRNFKAAVEMIENNLLYIEQFRQELHSVNQQSKFYRVALTYFGASMYKDALKWINIIINSDQMRFRKDVLSSVQLLNLLIHYELGNYDLLRNRINTTKNYLQKIDRWLPPEKLVLSTLSSIISLSKRKQTAFRDLAYGLKRFGDEDHLDKYVMVYFDLQFWAMKKSTGI
ncbi:hypothetical protein JYT72_00150 [Crocinitomix catalasitica]|nr:hypothetical protein [Crocinitomix catalasitica]